MIRTRVGYCGGQKANPTYYSLGDHTETTQIEFNPTQISYQQLLDIFWLGHNPTRKAYSRQYMSAVFLASNVSPLPSNKVYQLWLIQGDQPVGMGTFQVDEHGYGKLVVMAETAVSSFTAVGVSIEPTGDIVLLGTISS